MTLTLILKSLICRVVLFAVLFVVVLVCLVFHVSVFDFVVSSLLLLLCVLFFVNRFIVCLSCLSCFFFVSVVCFHLRVLYCSLLIGMGVTLSLNKTNTNYSIPTQHSANTES